jgi:hypothetical protein
MAALEEHGNVASARAAERVAGLVILSISLELDYPSTHAIHKKHLSQDCRGGFEGG